MSLVLETNDSSTQTLASVRLQATMIAARVSFTWLGVRKALNTHQKDQAAKSFGAEGNFLTAGKKLLDTSHPAFKAVTAIRSSAITYWKVSSRPFPEPGIRLIRQATVDEFNAKMTSFRQQLADAVGQLSEQYGELRIVARERLGNLFDAGDYPATLEGQFGIEHDFPNVDPPSYLQQLSPELYQQECQRMQSRFNEAVQLAEQAFIDELARLVEHLSERLSGTDDGKPKVFRDTAVTNLTEFFERFRQLNVRSNADLDALVVNAQRIVQGIQPQRLRDNISLRQHVSSQMAVVQAGLDQLLVDRPRRNIQRRPR